ncbi:MAG: hypothetical protein ACYCWW_10435 [Deltaproteobacteria bacterium]
MSGFRISGEGLDEGKLREEIDRRAGSELKPAPEEPAAPASTSDLFGELLRSLALNADSSQGFPPQSHRSFGGAVVAAKRGFRLAFQPFINEALARQRSFNQRLLDALAALRSEQLELEARLDRLEQRRPRMDEASRPKAPRSRRG